MVREAKSGGKFYIENRKAERERLVIPELESVKPQWKWLVELPESKYRQLIHQGQPDWGGDDLFAELGRDEPKEVAENWDLPLEVVRECILYGELNADYLNAEERESLRRMPQVVVP